MKTLLIAGFGDIASRALPELRPHFRIIALVRPERMRTLGTMPGVQLQPADLDAPQTLRGLCGRATHVLHAAPPPPAGSGDPRTANLLAALVPAAPLERLVYLSTSGVYGDCHGAWIDEQHPVAPRTERAQRRVAAERALQSWGDAHGVSSVILRVPGIYAADRLPLERLRRRIPVLQPADDVYTNHIHADDLVQIVVRALMQPGAAGVYHAADDSTLLAGDWLDLVADRTGLPRAPRVARSEAAARIPAAQISFLSESRRLHSDRMKRELGVVLRYPTVYEGLACSPDRSCARP